MDDKVTRMKRRLEVLRLLANTLRDDSPQVARKLRVLADNPGPIDDFQKIALELIATAQKTSAFHSWMLAKAQNAIFNDEDTDEALELMQRYEGLIGPI